MNNFKKEYNFDVAGFFPKIARIKGEYYNDVTDPEELKKVLKSLKTNADIFTFIQRIPDTTPKFSYYWEWDNMAALNIKGFDYWWTKQIKDKTRNLVRKAEKKGVYVALSDYNDEVVKGIKDIYDETPIRQGRKFRHFGKSIETVRNENGTYLDRSSFLISYYEKEVIGFIKIVWDQNNGNIMQILSKISHRDKSPTNILMAEAVRLCEEKNKSFLVYARYQYGKKGSDTLLNFKKHNGFEKIYVPRYYIPLNLRGRLALRIHIHEGLLEFLPAKYINWIRDVRNYWYMRKYNDILQKNL